LTKRVFPLREVSVSVRAPFTSSATALQANDANGAWGTVLSEMDALRRLEVGNSVPVHYFGVVKVSYTSGMSGYGLIGGRTAIGWDRFPNANVNTAHELGHNFGQEHAPCGTRGDGTYPYSGGRIGTWGWNSATGLLVAPTTGDIMGYCSNPWVSDWTWHFVQLWRNASRSVMSAAGAPTDGLLVWGRIVDGRVTLEPAFRVRAPATPSAPGASHRIVVRGPDGTLLDWGVNPERADHAAGEVLHFAVVLPWSETLERTSDRITVLDARNPLRSATRVARAVAAQGQRDPGKDALPEEPRVSLAAAGAGQRTLLWDHARFPLAIVRDAATDEVLALLRRPTDRFAATPSVRVELTDGVHTWRDGPRP
jgi:hypothetical protein